MKFTKMHGAGNDFIIINNMVEKLSAEKFSLIAKILCTRRMSIGADGLMVVDFPQQGGDYKMTYYNSDGSIGEMCGNGARCIARYGYEKGLADETQEIESTAGMVKGQRIDRQLYKIRLNDVTRLELEYNIAVDGNKYECSYVELGNPPLPHAVVKVENINSVDKESLRSLSKKLRFHQSFPKGANVNFYEITGEDEVTELTYERGVEDFTFACGTGTGAMVAVLTQKGLVSGDNVKVIVPGGELFITVEIKDNLISSLYLTGPTSIVCEGQVLDEKLIF